MLVGKGPKPKYQPACAGEEHTAHNGQTTAEAERASRAVPWSKAKMLF